MQNENVQNNQSNQIKRNPSRGNTNVNQGEANEKNLGSKNASGSNVEVNPGKQTSGSEIDLDRSGVRTSESDTTSDQSKISESGSEGALRAAGSEDDGSIGQQEIQQEEQQPADASRDDVKHAGGGAGYGATGGEIKTSGQGGASGRSQDDIQRI